MIRATTYPVTFSQGHRAKPDHLDHFWVVVHHFSRRPSWFRTLLRAYYSSSRKNTSNLRVITLSSYRSRLYESLLFSWGEISCPSNYCDPVLDNNSPKKTTCGIACLSVCFVIETNSTTQEHQIFREVHNNLQLEIWSGRLPFSFPSVSCALHLPQLLFSFVLVSSFSMLVSFFALCYLCVLLFLSLTGLWPPTWEGLPNERNHCTSNWIQHHVVLNLVNVSRRAWMSDLPLPPIKISTLACSFFVHVLTFCSFLISSFPLERDFDV